MSSFDLPQDKMERLAKISGHSVILGANDKLKGILEIFEKQDREIVIIVDDLERILDVFIDRHIVLEGDFILEENLRKARVKKAETVVILADTHNRSDSDADARSVLATLAVEHTNPEVKTVVEALVKNTAYHLKNAGVDEIIVSGDLTSEMLAFSTSHAGFSEHLSTLMRFAHKNQIVRLPVPERFMNKTVQEITLYLIKERRIVLGIMKKGYKETLDPFYKLQPLDEMVCIEII